MNNISWTSFTAAPHRPFFFSGAVQAILTLCWWMTDLLGRYLGIYAVPIWPVTATDLHAFLMIYGFFPFFIFGFLMTTYPRWMQGEEVSRRFYLSSYLMMSSAMLLLYLSLFMTSQLYLPALLLFVLGWTVGLTALLGVYFKAKHPDKKHATITSVMLFSAWLLILAFISGDFLLVKLAKAGGIWLFLLPLFFAVSHRMIPFFSANVIIGYSIIRPYWALMLVLVLAGLHLVLEMLDGYAWLWLADVPMAAIGFYLSYQWRLFKSLHVPLLAMLHISFAWFAVAMSLYSLQSFYYLISGDFILNKAPLHALVIGYFSSMLIAMATRVSLGHSGRPLAADKVSWGVFLSFQLVAVSRVCAEIPGLASEWIVTLYLSAGLLWLGCFSVWAWKFLPIYLKPRTDGKAG